MLSFESDTGLPRFIFVFGMEYVCMVAHFSIVCAPPTRNANGWMDVCGWARSNLFALRYQATGLGQYGRNGRRRGVWEPERGILFACVLGYQKRLGVRG